MLPAWLAGARLVWGKSHLAHGIKLCRAWTGDLFLISLAGKKNMLTDTTEQIIRDTVTAQKDKPGALLPILHGIQEALGHIPVQAVSLIAEELNLSRAEVHGVITFYHFFRSEPVGQTVVQICRAEACQSMGSERLWAHACRHLAVDANTGAHGATSADGAITLLPVYCLGLCSTSPAVAFNDKVHARMNADKFDALVAVARSAS